MEEWLFGLLFIYHQSNGRLKGNVFVLQFSIAVILCDAIELNASSVQVSRSWPPNK